MDHEELISVDVEAAATVGKSGRRRRIADDALPDLFGIEMSGDAAPAQAKSGKRTTQVKKKPASRKVSRKTATRAASSARPVTGKAIATLRAKFGMSQGQFARLLGVSTPASPQNSGNKSMLEIVVLETCPAGIFPGQRKMAAGKCLSQYKSSCPHFSASYCEHPY